MHVIHVQREQALPLDALPTAPPDNGFHWLDLAHEEFGARRDAWRDAIAALTGVQLHDLHLRDAVNLQHPSYFEATRDYDMLVFRKLTHSETPPLAELEEPRGARTRGRRLQEIVTRPVTFFVFERLLVTVSNAGSRTLEQTRQRLLDLSARGGGRWANGEPHLARLPQRPDELMLRLLNGMVDRYLELRQPLTERLDRWQRELLDPRRPFSDWNALLQARIEIRKLENLCEEQADALQELRDSYLESVSPAQDSDAQLVRIADVIDHVRRVLTHAQRLENSLETAVQLHFSAMAHRTNQVMRLLTVITAVFAPLTLITGVFGMNFETMPLVHRADGFWVTLAAMAALTALLLGLFWTQRVLSDRPLRLRRWWRRLWTRS
ncbi:MAG TPA: magnesium transporter CorA family protein [Burkholderiaceae bacterium]|nr:magnesium transporter CorA family protein [Burkholderiaceae bacterium]